MAKTLSVKLDDDDEGWLYFHARTHGHTVSDYVRTLIQKEKAELERLAALPVEPPKKLSLKEQFLAKMRAEMAPNKAAHELGLSLKVLKEWFEDPKFAPQIAAARMVCVESLQAQMIGIGIAKKNTGALGWVLNAQYGPYGPMKKAMILSILEPFLKKLRLFLGQELGADNREKIQKALDRWQLELRKRLSKLA